MPSAVVFQACTGGGCTVSEAGTATTVESAPGGVGDPIATSPTPSELLVTWSVPKYPNGLFPLRFETNLRPLSSQTLTECENELVFSLLSFCFVLLLTGVITQYRLYHNGLLIFSHPSQLQHVIMGLAAWSFHLLRLEACTSTGCSSSNEVEARTQEAPPEGTVGLDLLVNGPRTVSVNWNPVETPNGLVVYEVYFEGLYYVDPGCTFIIAALFYFRD